MFFHESKLQEFFSQIMDKIEDIIVILNWMSFEFFDIKAFFYYFMLSFLCLVITSIQKFYSARAYVLLCKKQFFLYLINFFIIKKVILINLTVEKLLFSRDLFLLLGLGFLENNFNIFQSIFFLRYPIYIFIKKI